MPTCAYLVDAGIARANIAICSTLARMEPENREEWEQWIAHEREKEKKAMELAEQRRRSVA